MKPKLSNTQILAVMQLLKNLSDFSKKGYGTIDEVLVLTNKAMPNTVIIKYEKRFTTAGELDYEFKIAAIGNDGQINFLDEKFKDVFERVAFLSECKPFNIEDENSYEKTD